MPLAETALKYWRWSQHLAGLKTQEEREKYVLLVLVPRRQRSYDPHEQRLLDRLIRRAMPATVEVQPA